MCIRRRECNLQNAPDRVEGTEKMKISVLCLTNIDKLTGLKAILEGCKRESRSPSFTSNMCESVDSAMSQWACVQA